MKYIVGIILIAFGVFMVWRTDLMMRTFGRNGWAEQHLGNGGSWSFYKIIGVTLSILGLLIMTGSLIDILDAIFR